MIMKKDLRTRLVSFFGSRGMKAVCIILLQLLCVPTVWAQVTEEDLDTVELFKTFPPTIEGKCEQQNIRLNIKQPYKLIRSRGYVPSQLPCDTKGCIFRHIIAKSDASIVHQDKDCELYLKTSIRSVDSGADLTPLPTGGKINMDIYSCLLYTSDAADE